jgi:hypothetical protein
VSVRALRSVSHHPLVYILILFALLLGLGSWWFLEHFEKKEFEVYQAGSPEAGRNQLLAAEHYLKRAGKQAESLTGLDLLAHLPSTGDAIFIRRLPVGLARNVSDSLLDWVEAGGHLLMVPNYETAGRSDQADLGTRIGVRYAEDESSDSDCGCPPDDEDETAGEDECVEEENDGQEAETATADDDVYRPFSSVMRVTIEGHNIELQSKAKRYLEDISDSANYRISGTYIMEYTREEDKTRDDNSREVVVEDAWLLQYKIGNGRVTVLSAIDLFENSGIDNRDNAFFLSHLVRDADKVWLLYSSNVDSLAVLAWKKMPLFWVSLLATILLFVWMRQMRPGPLRQPPGEQLHNILTHIDAIGRYCWRMDQCTELLSRNRRFFMNQWQKRKQGTRADGGSTKIDIAELAGKTGLSSRVISDAFHLSPKNEQDFIRSSRALQKCRQTLHRGNRKRSWDH